MSKNFLNPKDNDFVSSLRGLDLQDFLTQTENYFLEYRDCLNFSGDITFGVELEYESASRIEVTSFIDKKLPSWVSKTDGSLSSGGEINSPVMKDKENYWQELKMICDFLSKKRADTAHNAAGHIHIGATVLHYNIMAWKSFLKLYMAYEHVLFRFAYGDKISAREKIMEYACPVSDDLYKKLDQINMASVVVRLADDVLEPRAKFRALNFCNTRFGDLSNTMIKNTIEFRNPNASSNAVVWQNNINDFAKMLLSCRQHVVDMEFLDYKLKHEFAPYSMNHLSYSCVCLKDALEFVDIIFDNNLDKIYFLRQYLKEFQENYGIPQAVPAKKFVK